MVKLILLNILLFTISIRAQVVFVDVHDNIYEYLEKLSIRGAIDYNGEIKPLSRIYVAKMLDSASGKISMLTEIEKNNLEFYKKDYFNELSKIHQDTLKTEIYYFNSGVEGRFHAYSFSDSFLFL